MLLRVGRALEPFGKPRKRKMSRNVLADRQRSLEIALRLAPQLHLQTEPAQRQKEAVILRILAQPTLGPGNASSCLIVCATVRIDGGKRRLPLMIEQFLNRAACDRTFSGSHQ